MGFRFSSYQWRYTEAPLIRDGDCTAQQSLFSPERVTTSKALLRIKLNLKEGTVVEILSLYLQIFKSWSALLINQPNTKPCISYVPGLKSLSKTFRSFKLLLKEYPLVKGGFLFEYNLPIRNFVLINTDNKIDVFERY